MRASITSTNRFSLDTYIVLDAGYGSLDCLRIRTRDRQIQGGPDRARCPEPDAYPSIIASGFTAAGSKHFVLSAPEVNHSVITRP